MGEADGAGDDRTFWANFAGESAAMLRERVLEKLKEFMGDYTDDTLVEYVIVLLRNGRRKEEAKRELHVFLGDDSDSFISWLWDHMSLNSHLYVQQKEPLPDDMAIRKATATEQYERTNSQGVQASGASHAGSEHQGGNLVNVSRGRRKREWNGLVGEMSGSFPLRSTVTEALHSEQKTGEKPDVRHSATLRPQLSRKQNREDERRKTKRDTDLLPELAPSRRLLEFAIRDAVKTVQSSSSTAEPSVKRLRSVVFSSIDTALDEKPHRPRSALRMLGSVSVALKTAAEAAEDVSKSSNVGNDRFVHGRAAIEPIDHHSSSLKKSILQDEENEEFGPITRSGQVDYNKKNEYKGEFTGNSSLFERDADMPADSASDNDGYDDFGIANDHALDASQGAYSSNKMENSVKHYNVSKYADTALRKTRLVQQDPPPSASTKPSSKIVNISVNVNTWKPTGYYLYRNDKEGEIQMGEKNIEEATVQPNVNIPLLKENTVSISGNDKEMASDMQKESRKSQSSAPGISYTSSRPSDDVDSRTNFISNVHFAATKDTLSRHFNKFGEVLKVIIVTDPVNGQPIGSAYVEFLRKESAELALSLNGTSFMSRILKVVRRNFAEAPVMGWPRIARVSPFASRFGRMPLPRGILPGAFRVRLPIKPGARSMQWKRDSAASPVFGGAKSVKNTLGMPGNAPHSKTGRNLKYVRPGSQA